MNIRRGGLSIRRGGVTIRRRGVVLAHAAKTPRSFCCMAAGAACKERSACIHLQMYTKLSPVSVTLQKRLAVFPSPAGMSLTKVSLAGGNNLILFNLNN